MTRPMTADEVEKSGYAAHFYKWLGDLRVPLDAVTDLNRGRLFYYYMDEINPNPDRLLEPIPPILFETPGAILS